MHNIGFSESALGIREFGRPSFERALAILREVGDRTAEALCLSSLASSLVRLGRLHDARVRLAAAFATLQDLDAPREAIEALQALGEWLLASGRGAEAARILGATAAAHTALGAVRSPAELEYSAGITARLASELGAAEAARHRAEGEALSLAQAVAEAVALANDVPDG
jgi:hypothetical protein